MAQHILSAREVQVAREGQHADGGGLFLRVAGLNASWVFRYTAPAGQRRDMGLGSAERSTITAAGATLTRARELAQVQRQLLEKGRDPLDERRAVRVAAEAEFAQKREQARVASLTLCRAARDYHERVIEPRFSDKHSRLWIASLENNVPDEIWLKPLDRITPVELFEAIAKLRRRIPDTADKVRQRLDKVFDDAAFFGRCATNPARMIRNKVAETPRGRKEGHYAALPFTEVPAFLDALHKQRGTGARALEFALLAAARTGEVLGAVWEEIDEQAGAWRIPAERMKGGEAHVVFLSPPALKILDDMRRLGGIYLFPSPLDPRRPMSSMAMLEVLKRMGYHKRTTVHGVCRASFSTWANETSAGRPDVIEACLAHKEVDRVRAAYNRASFDAERRMLLVAWAGFVHSCLTVLNTLAEDLHTPVNAERRYPLGVA
ncbi:MAG TPA: integrase arm-type DNA-binding domain-containing protein [Burkholderiaceae bacterium]|nr:integrase arm-type DNA-binding domain-containing protein [Burkholderiaceae bacterium]